MTTMALAFPPQHEQCHNLFDTPLKHPKSRSTKMAFTSDIAVFNKSKNIQKIKTPKPSPRLNSSKPPSKHSSKINTAQLHPRVITAPAGATRSEWGRLEKSTSQRSSNYHKTLTAIYGDMNDLCREGKLKEALRALDDTRFRGDIPVDANMYEILLQACAKAKALERGKQVHGHMRLTRLDRYEFLRIRLVKMYASCGSIEDARQVFDETSHPSLQLWNAMIRGYVSKGFCEKDALEIYYQMRLAGVNADEKTFSCVLKACGAISNLQQGKEIHENIIRCKFQSNVVVGTALVDMYSRCGATEDARIVFDKMCHRNVITWTAMISGFTHSGIWDDALYYFRQMQTEGEKPNSVTLASVLPACGNTGDLQLGKEIHGYAIRNGFDVYAFVENALMEMYFKCGQLEAARDIFDNIPERGVVLYNTMIHGYAQNGYANEALEIFRQMNWNGVKLNQFTMINVLPVCGDLGALQKGEELHSYIIRRGFQFNSSLCSALINMYSKCGRIEIARNVFDRMSKNDVASWTALIAGYGKNGVGKEALNLFNQMQQAKVDPNSITLLAVLSACNHEGLVDEAWQCFEGMSKNYGIIPTMEHYTCLVDLLGRAGRLNEAYDLIQKIPLGPDAGVWEALMGACRIHCDIRIGEGAQHLLDLESQNLRTSINKQTPLPSFQLANTMI